VSVSPERLAHVLAAQESRPGDGVLTFVFAKGEEVDASHPAVLARPDLFDSCADATGERNDE
jgi:hypothetical protein